MTNLKSIALKRLRGRYDALIKLRHSATVRHALACLKIPSVLAKQRRNGALFPFIIAGKIGMGGALTHVLCLLTLSKRRGWSALPEIVNPLYSNRQEDIFRVYFKCRKGMPSRDGLNFHTFSNEWDYSYYFSLKDIQSIKIREAHQAFFDLYAFSPSVMELVAKALPPEQSFELSVHYRGTDKRLEAGVASFERFFEVVDVYISRIAGRPIFLASDDATFIKAFKERYVANPISMFQYESDDSSTYYKARHFSDLSPELKALESLVNMNLIARSKLCVRTASYLSAWSKIINPDLPIYTLNQMFDKKTFPEYEIWQERESVYESWLK